MKKQEFDSIEGVLEHERIQRARAAAPELVEALEGILMAYELLCDMHAHSFYKEPSSRAYAARALLARIKGE